MRFIYNWVMTGIQWMVRRWVLVHCSQWHLTPNLTMRSFVDIRVIQEKHSTRTLSLLWLKKNLQTSTLAFKGGRVKLRKPSILVINWVSSCLSFFLSAFTAATYIFTAPNCTTTIISLELCALNVDYKHFVLRFIKMSLLCGWIPLKEGIGGESRPNDRVKTGPQWTSTHQCTIHWMPWWCSCGCWFTVAVKTGLLYG